MPGAGVVIALMLLLAVQAGTAEDEIVVLGRRLATTQVIVGRDTQGKFTCGLSQSSGNGKLDAALCKAAAVCVRKGANDPPGVAACIEARKPALLDAFRRARGGKGAR